MPHFQDRPSRPLIPRSAPRARGLNSLVCMPKLVEPAGERYAKEACARTQLRVDNEWSFVDSRTKHDPLLSSTPPYHLRAPPVHEDEAGLGRWRRAQSLQVPKMRTSGEKDRQDRAIASSPEVRPAQLAASFIPGLASSLAARGPVCSATCRRNRLRHTARRRMGDGRRPPVTGHPDGVGESGLFDGVDLAENRDLAHGPLWSLSSGARGTQLGEG